MSALRMKLHALIDEIADVLETGGGDEWVDQTRSPLGRKKHLALAKRGVLPASKEGKQVLIKRSHIESYLATKKVIVVDGEAEEEREVAKVIGMLGRGRK
jgi:hypothetical protein